MATTGENLAPILEELHDFLWEDEARESGPPEYPDKSFKHAAKILMSVLMDSMWKLHEEKDIPLNARASLVTHVGKDFRKLILEATGVDMHD